MAMPITTLLLIVLQSLMKFMASRGGVVAAANFTLLPALENCLWIVFLASVIDAAILTANAPHYPHFLE